MREIVLDTETTGLDPLSGHRIVEIGAVELFDHAPTGPHVSPLCVPRSRYASRKASERGVTPASSLCVHPNGLSCDRLVIWPGAWCFPKGCVGRFPISCAGFALFRFLFRQNVDVSLPQSLKVFNFMVLVEAKRPLAFQLDKTI
jgi:Exonuclease